MTSLIFIGFSIPIAVCDIRSMKIPDLLIYSGISAMPGYRAAFLREGILLYICAALISAVLFVMVRKISKSGLGWADVKYAALCGLYAGLSYVFIGYVLTALFCGIFFLILKAAGRYGSGKAVPFTPFMALGTVSVMLIPIVKQLAC